MKRTVSYILIFILVILVYQLIVVFFANSHEVNYEIVSDNNNYKINEKYVRDDNGDGYYLSISIGDKNYTYYTNNYFNKQKRIIKNIKSYEEKDYLCIYPVDINQENSFEVLCSDGKETYSSHYLENKIDVKKFYKEIGTYSKHLQNLEVTYDYNNMSFYKNNFYNNEYLKIYRYKSLYVFNKYKNYDIQFSNKDIYKNNLGVYIDEYFFVPIINSNLIKSYYLINCLNNEKQTIDLDQELSTNIYILGTLKNKVYIFDLNNKLEYELSTDGSFKQIGNVNDGFTMYKKGRWEDTSITEFTNNRITIEKTITDELKYNYENIYELDNSYYFVSENKLYKTYKKNLESKILLLELNNYSNLQVSDDKVYYVSGEYLYRYDQYGLKTLVKNNEFNYNNTNIYHVYND